MRLGRSLSDCLRNRWGQSVALLLLLGVRPGVAAEPPATPAELFPDSTLAYLEVADPPKLAAAIDEHPVVTRLNQDDQYRPLLATPEYAKLRIGLGIAEVTLGMSWRKAVEQLTAGGLAVGFDTRTRGAALVARAADAETLARVRDLALKLIRDDASKKGNPDPLEVTRYRDVTAYRLDRLRFAVHGPWLIVSDNSELGQAMIDRVLDGPGENSLARNGRFRELRGRDAARPLLWGCLRLDRLREAGQVADLFRGKADNPVGELIAGGVLASLQKADALTVQLESQGRDFLVRAMLPHDPRWLPAERSYYFGEGGQGRAPAPLRPRGTLLQLTAYRDLAGIWNAAPELFDEKANAELNQANSGLSTLFSGRDFGQDVLASIRPEWQVVVARQDYSQAPSTPQIKLPAGALVVELRDPEKMRREWKVTFQSLIGFLNVVSSMQGQPPLELDAEKIDGIQLVSASYLPPTEGKKPAAGSLHYNFSPSLALVDARMVIASTRALALELARGPQGAAGGTASAAGESATDSRVNTQLSIDVGPLRAALADNRDQLIARSMLEKGHGRAAAEQEVDTLLKLSELIQGADLRLETTADRLELRLRLGF